LKSLLIRRGRHRSRFAWCPFFKKKKTFIFVFNETARYDIGENQDALNKLVGFSDGGINHHKNSFRLAWRYNKEYDLVEIHAYTYLDGERTSQHIVDCQIRQPMRVEVEIRPDVYRVVVNRYRISYYNRSKNIKCGYKHMLWPYFGGKAKAPHNIWISLIWK
jgi:hypothetical protein